MNSLRIKVGLLIFPCLMLLTACSDNPTPTIRYTLSPNELTIPRGGIGSIFVDLHASNARRVFFDIAIGSLPTARSANEVQVSFPASHDLLNCQPSGIFCSYSRSTIQPININQFEIKFQIPEDHDLGTWELPSTARADSFESASFLSNFASLDDPLTLTITD